MVEQLLSADRASSASDARREQPKPEAEPTAGRLLQAQRQTRQPALLRQADGLGNQQVNRLLQGRPDAPRPEPDPTAVKQAAQDGIRGSAAPLPHREQLARSFGEQALGTITAHIGGPAQEAAAALGAQAFATGEHLGFAEVPDLRQTAHEVTHVIQQRGGAAPQDGVGEEGDELEREAEAVADAVASGQVVAPRLERYLQNNAAPQGAGPQAVQRWVEDEAAAPGREQVLQAIAAAGDSEAITRIIEALSQVNPGDQEYVELELPAVQGAGCIVRLHRDDLPELLALAQRTADGTPADGSGGTTPGPGTGTESTPYTEALRGYDQEVTAEQTLFARRHELQQEQAALPRPNRRSPEQQARAEAIAAELTDIETQLAGAEGRKAPHRQVIRTTEGPQGSALADEPDPDSDWINLAHVGPVGVGTSIAGSLQAARQEVLTKTGYDLTAELPEHNGIRRMDQSGQGSGQIYCSWHKTGRALDLDQGQHFLRYAEGNAYRLFLPVTEGGTGSTVAALNARFGVTAPDHTRGTWRRNPDLAFVDVTEIMLKHGFTRIPVHGDGTPEWWHYELKEGLRWYDALLEVHREDYIFACLRRAVAANHVTRNTLANQGVPVAQL